METIFDHNVTVKELERFVGKEYSTRADSLKDTLYSNENDAYYALGILYAMRGDHKRSDEYFNKVKNPELLKALVEDF